jgi:hypothetical protein
MTCTLRSADDQENHKDYLERTSLTLSREPAPRPWGTLLGGLKGKCGLVHLFTAAAQNSSR